VEQAMPRWEAAQQALKRQLGSRHWDIAHEGLDHLIRAE
jgi:hypothetical protein